MKTRRILLFVLLMLMLAIPVFGAVHDGSNHTASPDAAAVENSVDIVDNSAESSVDVIPRVGPRWDVVWCLLTAVLVLLMLLDVGVFQSRKAICGVISVAVVFGVAGLSLSVLYLYDDRAAGRSSDHILMELSAADVDDDYIGSLYLPDLDLELPVMSEWSRENLKLSPCRYSGSVYNNDLILLAYNYDSHFGRLRDLKIGDSILFTDMDGSMSSYHVTEQRRLVATEVDALTGGDWDLTLFTCTADGGERIVIRAELD